MTPKKAYDKIDNTLCLNSQKLEFNIDNAGIDCKDVYEMVKCLDKVKEHLEHNVETMKKTKKYLKEYRDLKTLIKQNAKIEDVILHDCEDGNDREYEKIVITVKENNRLYNFLKEMLK